MTNQETTLLYILTTLAQTCAALAAFVGAVGLFRLQTLRDQHARAERDLRGLIERATGRESFRQPVEDVLATLDEFDADPARHNDIMPRVAGRTA